MAEGGPFSLLREPSGFPTSPEGVGRSFFTARIERPPLYRGGSASKKNGLPAPSHPSETARCTSTGDHHPPSSLPLSIHKNSGWRRPGCPTAYLASYCKGVARLVSNCARPTRAFRGRALREQRRLTGYPSLPTPGGVRGRSGWSATGPAILLSSLPTASYRPTRSASTHSSSARPTPSPVSPMKAAYPTPRPLPRQLQRAVLPP